ncbi:SusD/RagB family nutrient-binding outer membrane lipoprotein [Pedobacter sp. PLR]|uniref:SusD/RagB family nutrient-binding outer membrane lipoprotein n=1 Tax=Pedobacter sp. PLR TaxID=2994465 RepID=UPI00224689B9|nr:SusD/RagB family nutrient-binding outer membrane lipoprotein [Pedobacter sp. PLR]MCX2453014.1 SusD/RagB family nutrient-binding outer membrane lipoprotein [Pedobacter sp. PLR]
MKKSFINYIIFAASLALATGCKPGDFGDLNVSPNSPAKPVTSLMLTSAERYMGRTTAVTSVATVPGVINDYAAKLYTQQISEMLYTSESRYATKIYNYSGVFNSPLEDLALIIKLNTDELTKSAPNVVNNGSNKNQIAVARILKAFYFQNMTDRWGDIPYSESLQGMALITPKFDRQKDVYNALFKELKEAAAGFDSGAMAAGDFLFDGDQNKWKIFAATIRMNMALRLSKVDPALGKTEFNLALAEGVISSNADNIVYQFLSDSSNENNIYYNYEVNKRYDYAISNTMVDALAAIADPRLPVYADKNIDGLYVGMPYGLTQEDAGKGFSSGNVSSPGSVSLIGKAFRSQNSPVRIYTYAETMFSKAEAYKLGWITGAPDDAQAEIAYLAGIKASMDQNGVTAPAGYYLQAGVAYNAGDAVKQIITQKWMTNYMGYAAEAWSDWRRTGFPTLTPTPFAENIGKQIPVRQCYSNDEPSLNNKNYQDMLSIQGPDELSTPVWWDK